MSRSLYELMLEHSELNVLIGPPRSKPFREGPSYVLFVNGKLVDEGEVSPFVGMDAAETAQANLICATSNAIEDHARALDADTVIFRKQAEEAWLEQVPAMVSSIDGSYSPAQLKCRTRVAFINLMQGAYK
jgi:hypothetical protein